MTLFDIDKSGTERDRPSVNSHDQISGVIPARGTLSTNYTNALPNTTGVNTQLGALSLIQTGSVQVVNNGGTTTVTSFAHGLGFAPITLGAINNATVSGITGSVNLMLPAWASASLGGSTIGFTTWLSVMADATNVYFYLLNTTGSPITLTATYYLYRQLALQ